MTAPLQVIILRYLVPLEVLDRDREDHLKFLEERYKEGVFLLSGPQNPRTGGVILARASDRNHVLQLISQDPFFQKKHAEYQVFEVSVNRWAPELEDFFGKDGQMKKEPLTTEIASHIKSRLWRMGMDLIVMVGAGTGLGFWADSVFQMRPVGVLVGFILGALAAARHIYKSIKGLF